MKATKIHLFFILFVVSITQTFAQIKINANGEAKMGNEWPDNDYNNEVSHEIFGLNTTSYRPNAKLSIGDYGSSANGGANIFIGEAFGWDSDQLQIQAKNGIFFTIGGVSNIEAAKIESDGDFHALGDIYSRGVQITSDIRLKTNVKNLNTALASVSKLQGITYDFKSVREDAALASMNGVTGKTEKDIKHLQQFKKIYEDKKAENLNQIGFSAQEVQKIFPQLVKADENGNLSVNYIALIPVAIEAIKEQQKTIDDQAATIKTQQKDIDAIKLKLGMR